MRVSIFLENGLSVQLNQLLLQRNALVLNHYLIYYLKNFFTSHRTKECLFHIKTNLSKFF